MNLRKMFAAQLAACVVCSNASYVVANLSPWIAVLQTLILSAITFAIVQRLGRNRAIAVGSAVWIGLLSLASFLLSLSLRPRAGFDAGIYDRVPLLVGLTCAGFCVLFWILLPWNPAEGEITDFR
jgi:hypothetical protein